MKNIFSFLVLGILLSCANVMAPTGGPKDETPPKLLSTVPVNGQINYHGSNILLEFDEPIKLKNPKDEISINPGVKELRFTVKKNSVLVDFGEKLLDTTTYSISFRESIQDVNESNPAEDLNLAFSTGEAIDTLHISGNVTQLLNGATSIKYTVAVYQSDTFNIFKNKPSYYTRTNKEGNYELRNLKPGQYFLYSFEDKNKNLLLDSKSEKFGILKEKLTLLDNIDSIELTTIALDSRPIAIAGIRNLGHFTKIRYNKNLTHYSILSLDTSDQNIPNCFSASQSEIDLFPNRPATDSTLIKLIATDSLLQTLDTTFYVKQTTAKSLKEKIKISSIKTQLINDQQRFKAEFNLSELVYSITPDSIYILSDTTKRIPFNLNEIYYDTVFRKVVIEKIFNPQDSIPWKRSKFIVADMAFTSQFGDSSKRTSAPISIIKAEESATLIIESKTAKPNLVIELVDSNFKSLGLYPHDKNITIKNLNPSTVQLRAINDTNNNGHWDPGNPNLRILPEAIIYYKNAEGKQQIPLRANWEVNVEWDL